MRKLVAALFVLAVPFAAHAEGSRAFVQLRDKAQPLESLGEFLTKFVGDCGSDKDCQQKVAAYRTDAVKKSFYVILDDGAQELVKPGGFNPQTNEMLFDLTPFFESSGFALTHGQPESFSGANCQGASIPLIPMKATLPPNVMPMDVDRVFRTGGVRMQIIFKPMQVWKKPRKDQKNAFCEGVKAQVQAVRLTEAKTGGEIVSWVSAK